MDHLSGKEERKHGGLSLHALFGFFEDVEETDQMRK